MEGFRRISIVVQIKVRKRVENRARTLGPGGAVEVDKGMSVDSFSQQRELRAQGTNLRVAVHFCGM